MHNIFVDKDDIQGKKNVDRILSFHEDMINNKKPASDLQMYFRSDYIQHSPLMKTGAESVISYFGALSKKFPQMRLVVHSVIAVENSVWVHFNFFPTTDKSSLGVAGVDIYRFDDEGKLAEHWDVSQPIEDLAKALNSNGTF